MEDLIIECALNEQVTTRENPDVILQPRRLRPKDEAARLG